MKNIFTSVLFTLLFTSISFCQPKPFEVPPILLSAEDSLIDNESTTISIGLGNATFFTGKRPHSNWGFTVNGNFNLGKSYYLNAGVEAYEGYIHEKAEMFYLGALYKFRFYEKKKIAAALKLGASVYGVSSGREGGFTAGIFLSPQLDYWITRNISTRFELRTHILIGPVIFNPAVSLSLHL